MCETPPNSQETSTFHENLNFPTGIDISFDFSGCMSPSMTFNTSIESDIPLSQDDLFLQAIVEQGKNK